MLSASSPGTWRAPWTPARWRWGWRRRRPTQRCCSWARTKIGHGAKHQQGKKGVQSEGNNSPKVKTCSVFIGLLLNGCIALLNHWRRWLLDNKSNNATPSPKCFPFFSLPSPTRLINCWSLRHWNAALTYFFFVCSFELPLSTSAARLLQLKRECKEWDH